MKYFILTLFFPLVGFSQESVSKQIKEQRKEERSIADTMNFPDPFTFVYIDTISLTKTAIYNKSLQWLTMTTSNMQKHLQIQDSSAGKIIITDLEVTKNTTEALTIDIRDGKYRLTFDNCRYAIKGDNFLPIYTMKDSKNTRLKKYLIVQSNSSIADSFEEFLKRKDNF